MLFWAFHPKISHCIEYAPSSYTETSNFSSLEQSSLLVT